MRFSIPHRLLFSFVRLYMFFPVRLQAEIRVNRIIQEAVERL